MQIRYNILSLKESEFKINYDYKLENKDDVTFQFFHNVKADDSAKTIVIEAGCRIISKKDNTSLAEDSVRADFSIIPFDEVIKVEGNTFHTTIPRLIDTFISVTLGALRGIFAKNLVGTYLNGLVLPLIPMKVISDSHKEKDN